MRLLESMRYLRQQSLDEVGQMRLLRLGQSKRLAAAAASGNVRAQRTVRDAATQAGYRGGRQGRTVSQMQDPRGPGAAGGSDALAPHAGGGRTARNLAAKGTRMSPAEASGRRRSESIRGTLGADSRGGSSIGSVGAEPRGTAQVGKGKGSSYLMTPIRQQARKLGMGGSVRGGDGFI